MTLPVAGNPIDMGQVLVELGIAAGTAVSLGDANVRGLASVASGAISLSDLYGKSAVVLPSYRAHAYNWLSTAGTLTLGIPASTVAGDMLVLAVVTNGSAPGITGFTPLATNQAIKTTLQANLSYATASTSSAGSNISITNAGSVMAALLLVYKDADIVAPRVATFSSGIDVQLCSSPSGSAGDNALFLPFGFTNGGTLSGPPSGYDSPHGGAIATQVSPILNMRAASKSYASAPATEDAAAFSGGGGSESYNAVLAFKGRKVTGVSSVTGPASSVSVTAGAKVKTYTPAASVSVTPAGATGVTYTWEFVSGSAFTINSQGSATTTFSYTPTTNSGSRSGVYRCRVNQGTATYYSTNVTVSMDWNFL